MYYPKSQIIENLYTSGGEYMVQSTNKEYQGYYYKVSNNERYTGKNPDNPPNNLLVPISQNINYGGDEINFDTKKGTFWSPSYKFLQKQQGIDIGKAPQSPRQSKPSPTEEDYNNGLFNRYFLYNFTTKNTIEVNLRTYRQYVDNSPLVQYDKYTPLQITWALTGNIESVIRSNRSSVQIEEQQSQAYGFDKYFRNKYDQYYKFDTNENLYSDGKLLRYSKSKKPYLGYYHIHPEKGPMVGRQHTKTPHEYLEYIPTGSRLNPISPSIQSGSIEENQPTGSQVINYSGGSVGGSGGY